MHVCLYFMVIKKIELNNPLLNRLKSKQISSDVLFKSSRHLPIFAYLQCDTNFHRWGVTASSSTVHSHFFLMAKKKFRIFRGWGAGLFCSAGESCLNGEQERNTARRKRHCRGPSAKSRRLERVRGPAGGRALRNPAASPRSSAVN